MFYKILTIAGATTNWYTVLQYSAKKKKKWWRAKKKGPALERGPGQWSGHFSKSRGRDTDINHYRENSHCQENPGRGGKKKKRLTNVELSGRAQKETKSSALLAKYNTRGTTLRNKRGDWDQGIIMWLLWMIFLYISPPLSPRIINLTLSNQ